MAGFLVLSDPPRGHAADALDRITRAGVRPVLIISGDHPVTARRLATEVGLPLVVSGLEEGNDGDLGRALEIGIGISAIAVMLVCAAGIVTTASRYSAHRRE
ncbi:hypothetical protein [Nocardia asiatica]|uniref:hypothetical protein n=1 Tax=Nocardia asiatica TaxID=209252 RepID=UPI003EDED4A1